MCTLVLLKRNPETQLTETTKPFTLLVLWNHNPLSKLLSMATSPMPKRKPKSIQAGNSWLPQKKWDMNHPSMSQSQVSLKVLLTSRSIVTSWISNLVVMLPWWKGNPLEVSVSSRKGRSLLLKRREIQEKKELQLAPSSLIRMVGFFSALIQTRISRCRIVSKTNTDKNILQFSLTITLLIHYKTLFFTWQNTL